MPLCSSTSSSRSILLMEVRLARDGYPVPMPWGCPCLGEAAGVAGSGLPRGRAGRVQGIERVLERRTGGERRRRRVRRECGLMAEGAISIETTQRPVSHTEHQHQHPHRQPRPYPALPRTTTAKLRGSCWEGSCAVGWGRWDGHTSIGRR
jgi:hypothetical protein